MDPSFLTCAQHPGRLETTTWHWRNLVTRVFNSPFELGFRMVYLLSAMRPGGADLQKLILLDYAVVYSGDLGGPDSLHTPVPYRGSELLSRRTLIEQGLHLMSSRGLSPQKWMIRALPMSRLPRSHWWDRWPHRTSRACSSAANGRQSVWCSGLEHPDTGIYGARAPLGC